MSEEYILLHPVGFVWSTKPFSSVSFYDCVFRVWVSPNAVFFTA